MRIPLLALVAAPLLATGLVACSDDSDKLIIYSGRSEELVGPILEQLEEQVDVDVEVRYADSAELAAQQPGYLGVESVRGADGLGITVSYWESEAAILAWRRNAEHTLARERGRTDWYEHYELRVAKVERAYGGPGRQEGS